MAWVGLFCTEAGWAPGYLFEGWVGGNVLYFLRMLCFLCFCSVCGRLLLSRRQRIQVIDENAAGRRLVLGGHFCESIRIGVLLLWDVVELQTTESAF